MKTLTLVVVLCLAYPLAAEPINPLRDFPIAAPTLRPYTEIASPQVTSDGDGFFAVWGDPRSPNTDVYGARFDASGELLDREGVVVHATYENDGNPVAVWNGRDYVTFSSSGFLGGWNTIISKSGEVLGGGGERLPPNGAPNAAAFNSSRYGQTLVTFSQDAYRLELVLRDDRLNIVRRVQVEELAGVGGIPFVRIASNGRGFLVVWEKWIELQRVLSAAIVDGDGTITTPAFELRRGAPTRDWSTFLADVAWNGTSYLVVWSAPDGVYAQPIAPDGTSGAVKLVASGESSLNPAVAWDGRAHLVLWTVHRTFTAIATRGAIITATGEPVETFDVAGTGFYRPAIASNGDVFFAIVAGETFVIRSTGPTRVVRRGGAATYAYTRQESPAIAAGATNVMTAWTENRQTVWAGRLSKRGEPLDGGGLLVAEDLVSTVKVHAARGFYVVSWQNSGGETRIARITESGEVIDPGGIVIATIGTLPAVASNGSEMRMVWGRRNPVTQSPPIELVTATLPDRGPIGEPTLLAPAGSSLRAMRLFPNGDRFTMLFERQIPPACPQTRFCAAEFEYSSAVIGADGLMSAPIVVASRGLFFDGATDGRSILITYYVGLSQQTRRLDLDGVPVAEAVDLPTAPQPTQFPRLVRTAKGFVLLINRAGVDAIHLDRDGRPVTTIAPLLERDHPQVTDAAYVDGQTWLAYMAGWVPLPNAHNAGIQRAWVHVLGARQRAVR